MNMVRFRTGLGTWVVPLEHALEVRPVAALRPLPAPADGVAGVVEHGARTLPVVQALGGGDRHVLLLADGARAVGVLVDEVTGVVDVTSCTAGPAPGGQRSALVAGTVREGDELAYVLDVGRLADDVVGAQEDDTP